MLSNDSLNDVNNFLLETLTSPLTAGGFNYSTVLGVIVWVLSNDSQNECNMNNYSHCWWFQLFYCNEM